MATGKLRDKTLLFTSLILEWFCVLCFLFVSTFFDFFFNSFVVGVCMCACQLFFSYVHAHCKTRCVL